MTGKKIRIAVLYGGCSGEHEVSLQSASFIIQNLSPKKFDVIPIGIDKSGQWHLVDPALIADRIHKSLPLPTESPLGSLAPHSASEQVNLLNLEDQSSTGAIDVVFPALHGPLCEDGVIQGFCETAGVAYVGAGVLGSAIGMDKDVAKRLAVNAGIPVVPSITCRVSDWEVNKDSITKRVASELAYPVFVKPANMGSSVGVVKVSEQSKLDAAMEEAFQYDRKVLIERAVDAREIEFAVLEDLDPTKEPRVSVPGEIIPQHEFYSYEAKYLDENGAVLEIPAKLQKSEISSLQDLARKTFLCLECEGMARADFFVERGSGKFFLNEINTLPGFTSISMYPKLWEASGLPSDQLLEHLVKLAMTRHGKSLQLRRSFTPK